MATIIFETDNVIEDILDQLSRKRKISKAALIRQAIFLLNKHEEVKKKLHQLDRGIK